MREAIRSMRQWVTDHVNPFVLYLFLLLLLGWPLVNRQISAETADNIAFAAPDGQQRPLPAGELAAISSQRLIGESDAIWQDGLPLPEPAVGAARDLPAQYRFLLADTAALQHILATAPEEFSGRETAVLALPLPDGSFQRFQLESYSMMEPELAAKYPHFQTYKGRGLDDPTATARLDWTSHGFNAIILTAGDTFFIAPYQQGDQTHYISYDSRALPPSELNEAVPLDRLDDPVIQEFLRYSEAQLRQALSAPTTTSLANATLRTFRLAAASTGEFSQAQGGTVDAVMATLTNMVNQVNAFYEREASIRFILVANNNQIIFLDPNTDPYTGHDAYVAVVENQLVLDTVIGSANYDVGHVLGVFDTTGLAYLGSACNNAIKAKGASDDQVGVLIHELGHQFAAHHTFNADNTPECADQRSPIDAYEPGGGSTIMAYVFACGEQSIQTHVDYFLHTNSFSSIINHVTQTYPGCGTTQTINNPPVVDAGPNYAIPAQTKFALTGTASDPDNDPLTYSWEQYDLGPPPDTLQLPNLDDGFRPIFRSYPPQTSPVRTFPSPIYPGLAALGEYLPTTSRTLTFRFTARDNLGGVSYDTAVLTVAGNAGPFQFTSPLGFTNWQPNSQQTITWNVANTNVAPVSCSHVNLLLSQDGGQSYPITLAANLPNTGSASFTVPNLPPTMGILKLQCANNIFFDTPANQLRVCTHYVHEDQENATHGWYARAIRGNSNWLHRADGGYSGARYWSAASSPTLFNNAAALISPVYVATSNAPQFSFVHRYQMEMWQDTGLDGGVVEIRVNNGPWVDVGAASFRSNGYTYPIRQDSGSLLAGRMAFSGMAPQYIESSVDLSAWVNAGDAFQIRFYHANDAWPYNLFPSFGWHIDDVSFCGAQLSPTQPPIPPDVPVGGTPVPELAAFDQAMLDYMAAQNIHAGVLVIKRGNTVVYERSFGWQDRDHTSPLAPTSLLRMGDVGRVITMAAVEKLIAQGVLSRNDKVFCLGATTGCWLDTIPFGAPDSRLGNITIEHVLRHQGGWNPSISGDPMNNSIAIAQALGIVSPPEPADIARYVAGRPLDFTPGTQTVTANVGYMLLGLIIEESTGMSYPAYIQTHIFQPLGVPGSEIELGRTLPSQRNPREPWYDSAYVGYNVFPPHHIIAWPDGAWYLEAMAGHGGLVGTGRALVEFARVYRGDNGLPHGGSHNWWTYGFAEGTFTMLRWRPDNTYIMAMFNSYGPAFSDIRPILDAVADSVSWPVNPTATPSPSSTATNTPTPGPSSTPTHTPTAGPSPTPTSTATPSPSPTATNTPTPGPSPTSTNTATPSPSPTVTNTPTPGPSPTSTNTATPGPSPTATPVYTHHTYLPVVIR